MFKKNHKTNVSTDIIETGLTKNSKIYEDVETNKSDKNTELKDLENDNEKIVVLSENDQEVVFPTYREGNGSILKIWEENDVKYILRKHIQSLSYYAGSPIKSQRTSQLFR